MKRKNQNGFWKTRWFWMIPALALASRFCAGAQSNSVPTPADYSSFARFISERNIFDSTRYPRRGSRPRPARATQVPTFALVGTMSYDKGMFAFFDGTSSAYQKALQTNGTIAGYIVTEITANGVKLKTDDKELTLKIGAQMRQEAEGGGWQLSGQGESPVSTENVNSTENTAPGSTDSDNNNSSSSPNSALEGNDVLKKLMQRREQQLK